MERFELARTLVLQAGDMLRRIHFEFDDVHQKTGHQDLVTKWDAETERFLRHAILSAFPQDAIIGEEFPAAGQNGNVTWYLDPIDGTTNFINAHRSYAVSVGCWQDTTPLFGLVLDAERQTIYSARAGHGDWRDETAIHVSGRSNISDLLLSVPDIVYTFLKPHPHQDGIIQLAQDVRGIRSLGSVALELCAVAAGEADLFIAPRSSPWDHNAARIILCEAGGSICSLHGMPLPVGEKSAVLAACSKELEQTVLSLYFPV